jgi:hypothetical protein
MTLVAAPGGHQDVGLVAARRDGGGQVGLPRHGRVDLAALEHGGGRGGVLGDDDGLLQRVALLGGQARLREEVQQQPVRGRELGGGDALAGQVLDRLDGRQRNHAVAAARPVLHEDGAAAQVGRLGEQRGLAGPRVDGVPHDVDLAGLEGGELGGRILEEHELHVDAVLRLVDGAGVARREAEVGHDTGGVPGPRVDADLQRAGELTAGDGRAGHAGDTLAARILGRLTELVEVTLLHAGVGHGRLVAACARALTCGVGALVRAGEAADLGAEGVPGGVADDAQHDEGDEDLGKGCEFHGSFLLVRRPWAASRSMEEARAPALRWARAAWETRPPRAPPPLGRRTRAPLGPRASSCWRRRSATPAVPPRCAWRS